MSLDRTPLDVKSRGATASRDGNTIDPNEAAHILEKIRLVFPKQTGYESMGVTEHNHVARQINRETTRLGRKRRQETEDLFLFVLEKPYRIEVRNVENEGVEVYAISPSGYEFPLGSTVEECRENIAVLQGTNFGRGWPNTRRQVDPEDRYD